MQYAFEALTFFVVCGLGVFGRVFVGVFLLRGSGNVRRDHVTVNDRVRRISAGTGANTEIIDQGKNDRYTAQRRCEQKEEEQHVNGGNDDQTENCHQITLDAECRKDQSIFEDLANGKIEGNKHQINVKTHDKIQHDQGYDAVKAEV